MTDTNAPAPEAAPAVEPTQLTPEQYKAYAVKFKVGGQERAATLDEIIQQASLAEGSRAKFNQAMEERKKAESLMSEAQKTREQYQKIVSLLQQAKADPRVFKHVVNEIGADHLNDFITDYIKERAAEAKLTPEQKQLKEYQAKVAAYEKQQAEAQERAQQEALQQRGTLVYNTISNEFADAIASIEKTSVGELGQLPDSSPRKQAVYLAMDRALTIAQKQLTQTGQFEPLSKLYRKGQMQVQGMTSVGKQQALEELIKGEMEIPKELLKTFSKQQVEALKKAMPGRLAASSKTGAKPVRSSKKPMSIDDFFDRKRR